MSNRADKRNINVIIDLVVFGIRVTEIEEIDDSKRNPKVRNTKNFDLCVLLEHSGGGEKWALPKAILTKDQNADQVAEELFNSIDADTDNKPIFFRPFSEPTRLSEDEQAREVSFSYYGMIEQHHFEQAEDGLFRSWFKKHELTDAGIDKESGSGLIIKQVREHTENLKGAASVTMALELLPDKFFVRDTRHTCLAINGREHFFGMYARLLEKGEQGSKSGKKDEDNPLRHKIRVVEGDPVKPTEGKGRPAKMYEKVRRK